MKTKNTTRRITAFIMALLMVLSCVNTTGIQAYASEIETATVSETKLADEIDNAVLADSASDVNESETGKETAETEKNSETEKESALSEEESSLESDISVDESEEVEEEVAESTNEISLSDTQYCGENCTWVLNDGVLTISGTGAMTDYAHTKTPWYSYKNTITSVIVEEGVTTIGTQAFRDFSNLESLSIPSTVTTMKESSAEECTSLETVTFAAGSQLAVMERFVFYDAKKLSTISLPEGLTSIGERSFYMAGTTAGYEMTSITIPASVTTLGNRVFLDCRNLQSVNFAPSSQLNSIDYGCFSNCYALTSITIPSGVTTLPKELFLECRSLETYTIPSTVTTLSDSIFKGCTSLKNITIPSSITDTNLKAYMFSNCSELTTVTINANSYNEISSEAFYGCTKLENISLPSTIKYIRSRAFERCSALTQIKIPAAVEQIDSNAFKSCTNLSAVTFEGTPSITSIGDYAFEECTSLGAFTIPSTVTKLGTGTFKRCESLSTVVLPSGITSINDSLFYGCKGFKTYEVPKTITSIGDYAFCECTELTSVSYAKNSDGSTNIEKFGGNIFKGCSKLTSVEIPSNTKVQYLNSNLFYGCSLLTNITIPSNILYIRDNAFYGTAIESISIPAGVKELGTGAFNACKKLAAINVDEENTVFYSKNGIVFKKSDNSVYLFPYNFGSGEAVIPSELTTIKKAYFNGNKAITSVTIPATVTEIEESAFENCEALESVTFLTDENGNSGLTTINKWIFYNCPKLSNIELPFSVTTIGERVFYGTGIKEFKISKNVSSINKNTFDNCKKLEAITVDADNSTYYDICGIVYLKADDSQYITPANYGNGDIVIPEGVKVIKKQMFQNKSGLTSVVIATSVETIEEDAFYNCPNLTSITFKSGSKLKKLDGYAFQRTGIVEITLPSSVEEIASTVFKDCSKLARINVEEGNKKFYSLDGILVDMNTQEVHTKPSAHGSEISLVGAKAIPKRLFYNSSISSITIPATVEIIADDAFYYCSYLNSVTFESGSKLQSIGSNAFYGNRFTEITIPKSVTSISQDAFNNNYSFANIYVEAGNTKFKSVNGVLYTSAGAEWIRPYASTAKRELVEGVTELTADFYKGDTSITEITIPKSVEKINSNAFEGCTSLKTIKFVSGSKLKKIGSEAFKNTALTSIVLPDGVTELGYGAFRGCSSLQSVTLGKNITSIESNTFYDCSNLATVKIAGKITKVGDYAFYYCTSLKAVSLPATVTSIGNRAFYGDSMLTTCALPAGLVSLGTYSFSKTSIGSVTTPVTLTSIGTYAFGDCSALKTVNVKGKYLGTSMFENCTSLSKVTLAAGITTIPSSCFGSCKNLSAITLPATVTSIGKYAFEYSKLAKVIIPEGVTCISNYAFYSCANLTEVSFKGDVTTIGDGAFSYCEKLSSFNIPKTVTSIGNSAFSGCKNIKISSVPKGVTSLGDYVFRDCVAIKSMSFPAGITSISKYAFMGCSSLESFEIREDAQITPTFTAVDGIIYSNGGKTLYLVPEAWELPGDSLVIPEGVESIPSSIFDGNDKVEYIVLPSTITSLDNYAFSNCTRLKGVTFAENSLITTIPGNAFYGCSDLNYVEFKGTTNVSSIGSCAFMGCNDLACIKFENNESEMSVGSKAFYGDSSFEGIYNGEGLQVFSKLNNDAFSESGIKAIYLGANFDDDLSYANSDIVYSAINKCYELANIYVDAENETYVSKDGVLYSKDYKTLYRYPEAKDVCEIDSATETIADGAFAYNMKLRNIIIPASVIRIGRLAFVEAGITSVKLEEGSALTTIGDYAFKSCGNLNSFDFGNCSLKSIGAYAFAYNTSLSSLEVPDTVTTLGHHAFYNSSMLVVNIPASLTGVISTETYSYTKIKKAIIPEGVTSLGVGAFSNCSNMTEVLIPASVQSIGKKAFYWDRSLSKVTFADNSELTYIGFEAFGCDNCLSSIVVPEGVTTISAFAFESCSKLEKVTLPSTLSTYETGSYSSGDFTYKSGSYLFAYCTSLKEVIIKNTTATYGKYMFYKTGSSSKDIVIYGEDGSTVKEYVDNYDEYTYNGKSLNSKTIRFLTIGSEYTPLVPAEGEEDILSGYINEEKSIKWNWNSRTSILSFEYTGSGSTILSQSDSDCEQQWEDVVEGQYAIEVGEGITEIGDNAFYYAECDSVSLPSTLTSIGEEAFYDCYSIKSITIPAMVTNIGDGAFMDCSGITSVVFEDGCSIDKIPANAFKYCSSLTSITIPASVKKIEEGAFYWSTSLTEVLFEEGSQLESIGWGAFEYCTKLTTIADENGTFPDGLKRIEQYAFYSCRLVAKITLPVGIEYIANYAFGYCEDLSSVVISEENTKYKVINGNLYEAVEVEAEDGTTSITYSLVLSVNGESVDEFIIAAGVTNLPTMTLDSVKKRFIVEDNNAEYCSIDGILFSKDKKTLIRVPSEYEGFTDGNYNVPDFVTNISSNAFEDVLTLKKVTIPDGVDSIGYGAFYGCENLETVNLSEGLSQIGSSSFYKCYSLKTVKIPNSVSYIGAYAFEYCSSLESLTIPEGITKLPYYMCGSCTLLKEVYLPESLEEIYTGVFYKCTSLKKLVIPDNVKSIDASAFSSCLSLESLYISSNTTDIDKVYYSSSNRYNTPFDYDSKLTIYGQAGSYIDKYVESLGSRWSNTGSTCSKLPFVAVSDTKYTINYMLNEGERNNAGNPSAFRDSDSTIVLKPATKPGFYFAGWYTDEACENEITEINPLTRRNYIVYPLWLENHTVSIYSDGNLVEEVEIPHGKSLADIAYEDPVKEGFTFTGYKNESGKAFAKSIPITEDITISAIWTKAGDLIIFAPEASIPSGKISINDGIELTTQTKDAQIYYTIDGTEATKEAILYNDVLVHDGDSSEIVIHAIAVKDTIDEDGQEVTCISAEAVFTYEYYDLLSWGDLKSVDRSLYANPDQIPEGVWFAGIDEKASYTGSAITFNVRVYNGKTLLESNKDYTIKYTNNINAAKSDSKKAPTVTITGKGNFKGSYKKTFTILPYEIDDDYQFGYKLDEEYVYTKKVIKAVPVIYFGTKKLSSKNDYSLSYPSEGGYKEPGNYEVVVTFKGNFKGTKKLEYAIVDKIPLKKAKLTGLKNLVYDTEADYYYSYNGFAQDDIVLSYKKDKKSPEEILVNGSDYSVSYENNKSVGTAKIIITANSNSEFTGKIEKTFKITGYPISKAKVTGIINSIYNGRPQYMSDLKLTYTKKIGKQSVTSDLTIGENYLVSYTNNTKTGKAQITITGKGAYTGTIKKTFAIKAYAMDKDQSLKNPLVKVAVAGENPYAKGGAKPAVKVTYKGMALTEGKDYTLKYSNNTKVTSSGAKPAMVTVVGKGNFSGKLTANYTITKQNLTKLSAETADVKFTGLAGISCVPVIKDIDGKVLKAGTDYDKEYIYEYAEPVKLVDGTNRRRGDTVQSTDIVPEGAVINAIISGCGNYEGTLTTTFRVCTLDIKSASVKLKDGVTFVYNGRFQTPSKDQMIIVLNGETLSASDYDIVSCTGNLNCGMATLVIKGKGSYCGKAVYKFKINTVIF